MISVILWVIAFILAAVLFMPLWSRIGPRVYALSRSHAVQIAGMAATFIITFIAWPVPFFSFLPPYLQNDSKTDLCRSAPCLHGADEL